MKSFRDLKVWDKAHQLTLGIYEVTAVFPEEERYGLISQLRRSSSSVAANIAEGCGRGSDADLARFVQMAMGSASEVEYHLLLSHDLTFLSASNYEQLDTQVIEVKRMLAGLLDKLRAER